MAGINLLHRGISVNRFLSHFASSPANTMVIISESIVDRDIHDCFFDFHEMVALPHIKL